MEYYLRYKTQKPEELIYDINYIGHTNMDNTLFYVGKGYDFLKKIITLNELKLVNKFKIISEDNKNIYTVEEFISYLEEGNYKLIRQKV